MRGDENWEPDYEEMYAQLSKQKREYGDQLSIVVLCSTTLESIVNTLVEIWVKKLPSPLLERNLKHAYVPICNKVNLLRFGGLIDENNYGNLTILFRIRNKLSHELFITTKESTSVFEALKNAYTDNEFLKNLPNDSKKFELFVSKCSLDLIRICKKIDPSSVQNLGVVEEIKEMHEFE